MPFTGKQRDGPVTSLFAQRRSAERGQCGTCASLFGARAVMTTSDEIILYFAPFSVC